MWKSNIILRQTKSDGTGSRTAGPAAGAKIKRDVDPVIPVVSNTKLLTAANNKVFTDTGISLPGHTKVGIKGKTYNNGLAKPEESDTKDKKKFSETKFGQTLSSETAQGIYSGIGAAASLAGSFIDRDTIKNPTGYNTQQTIGTAMLNSGNPYLMAAGAAYNTLSTIAEATGGNVNTITKEQANNAGLTKSERFFNNVLGAIPGLGWAAGSETVEGQKSHLIDEMSNAYADSVYDIDQAQILGGSKFLFGKSKINNSIKEANRRNQQLTDINLTNTMRKKSDYAQDLAQQNLNRYMGTNYMDMRMGKQGMKFPELDDIREMLKNRVLSEENIQKFADGGSILPTGKLHKELHHMDQMGEQYEDLTRKGIPVVTLDENNEIQQVAEIEHSEVCLSKEVTDQLESLWKIGDENAMIQAGKLIANELLYNTKDENNVIWGGEKQQKNS